MIVSYSTQALAIASCFVDCIYVEHIGATLYSKSQIAAYQQDLLSNLYGNPHSRSESSRLATDTVDQVRFR